ncbi:hypothetical protein [Porphyrobacter sp. ULC335]|uniref:hypothetical protein n=1 Tax=Porphyrobacter sp. ULC335 TaxID=2854260 RepID=UPI00221E5CDD|nr:hypothetical protein [Porphyrobacter sp. ULC335]UYV14973.1 hypothetical protein KVF90_12655 [Porphyrobacter sp. ULC335]
MNLARPVLLLCAALWFGTAATVLAKDPPAKTAAPETITIPFAPPIDAPLTYRLRFERKRESGDSVIEVDQRLTFAKTESGYALTLEPLSIGMAGQRLELADKRVLDDIPPALRIYLLPVVIELDATGEMVRMRNWEAMQESLRDMPEATGRLSGRPVNEGALAAMRSVLEPYINSTAEQAPALMIRGWPAMLGYGGGQFVSGAVAEGDVEIATPFSPTPIPAVSQGSVTRTREGNISLVQTTRIDPEVMRMLMLGVIERMRTQAAWKGTGEPANEIRGLEVTDEIGLTLDPVTGLPIIGHTKRLTSVTTPTGSQVGGEITTITRIAP